MTTYTLVALCLVLSAYFVGVYVGKKRGNASAVLREREKFIGILVSLQTRVKQLIDEIRGV